MTRRPSSASRRWAILASGLVALVFVGLAVADAAQLNVSGPGIYAGSQARCTNGPVAITGGATHSGTSYTSISLTNLAAACSGKAIQVTIYNVSGVALATGTGTAGTAPFDIATTAFTSTAATGVALLVGTWGVPTTWTPPSITPPVSCIALNGGGKPQPSKTCTVTFSPNGGAPWGNSTPPGGTLWNFTFNVTSQGASWEATIDFTNTAFPFQPRWVGQNSVTVAKAPGYTCGSPVSTLVVQPTGGSTWGGSLDVGSLGAPNWWSGNTLCP